MGLAGATVIGFFLPCLTLARHYCSLIYHLVSSLIRCLGIVMEFWLISIPLPYIGSLSPCSLLLWHTNQVAQALQFSRGEKKCKRKGKI